MSYGLIGTPYYRHWRRKITGAIVEKLPDDIRTDDDSFVGTMTNVAASEAARYKLMMLRVRVNGKVEFAAHCVRRWTIDLAADALRWARVP